MAAKRPPKKAPAKAGADFTGDIAELARFPSCWVEIFREWRNGTVDRAGVIRALEAGHPVPPEANDLLAGLLDGSIKAKPGNKPLELPPRWMDGYVARTVEEIKVMLRHPDRIPDEYDKQWRDWLTALRSRSSGTVHQKALEATAHLYECTTRRVRESITRENRALQSIADKHGVTLAAVKRGQGYGEVGNMPRAAIPRVLRRKT